MFLSRQQRLVINAIPGTAVAVKVPTAPAAPKMSTGGKVKGVKLPKVKMPKTALAPTPAAPAPTPEDLRKQQLHGVADKYKTYLSSTQGLGMGEYTGTVKDAKSTAYRTATGDYNTAMQAYKSKYGVGGLNPKNWWETA